LGLGRMAEAREGEQARGNASLPLGERLLHPHDHARAPGIRSAGYDLGAHALEVVVRNPGAHACAGLDPHAMAGTNEGEHATRVDAHTVLTGLHFRRNADDHGYASFWDARA